MIQQITPAPRALTEVKILAKKHLKACQAGDAVALDKFAPLMNKQGLTLQDIQLKHCQSLLARELGFTDFNHCQRVLSGQAQIGEDLGTLFHSRRCDSLLNHWFSGFDEAQAFLQQSPQMVLLPYKKQFFVVNGADYLDALGLKLSNPASIYCISVGSETVAAYEAFSLSLIRHKLT
ncbi:hypothetical protein [Shewanella sp. GD03713]|uniref:hypothetical protein n=1 Tax=Shewanella sp. GD03713 TaxID=2975372 RepID=UPI000B342503|nr:hypothetical protein [Shewanella sp. GD03713]MDH1470399.1 hypothetical protein [Shewanella sp. GD03713]QXN23173.1 hypothetical protein KVP08_010910 [Shewanella putrefaciens]VEE64324.1 Uncharacterised protein [Shewanella putrefaciens]